MTNVEPVAFDRERSERPAPAPRIDLSTMTGGELRANREMLGLSPKWMADWLLIGERDLERLEQGFAPIQFKHGERAQALMRHTDDLVSTFEAEANRQIEAGNPAPQLLTFSDERDYEYWAKKLASQIMRVTLPPTQNESTYETIRIRAVSLLMAGKDIAEVGKAIQATITGDTADPNAMAQWPPLVGREEAVDRGMTGAMKMPARWHRQVCARVSELVPESIIVYANRAETWPVNDLLKNAIRADVGEDGLTQVCARINAAFTAARVRGDTHIPWQAYEELLRAHD